MKPKNYITQPVICEAFRLEFADDKPHRWLRNMPEWFQEMYSRGEIMITNSDQHGKYATITKQSGHIRALDGSWIIRANERNAFVMTDEEFAEHFILYEG